MVRPVCIEGLPFIITCHVLYEHSSSSPCYLSAVYLGGSGEHGGAGLRSQPNYRPGQRLADDSRWRPDHAGRENPVCGARGRSQCQPGGNSHSIHRWRHQPGCGAGAVWVAVELSPASDLLFDERGAVLMVNAAMRNVGHSVAKHVSLWTEFVLAGHRELNEAHDKLCNIMKDPRNANSDYGSLLFPNQGFAELRPIIAQAEHVREALQTGHFKEVKAIGLHIIGCVDYQSTFDPKKHHQTKFVYLVGRVDTQRGMVMGTFEPAVKRFQQIVLTPTGHGASAD